MRKAIYLASVGVLYSFSLAGCITSGGTTPGQNTVLVSEIVTLCGNMVGGQAEQRINEEWSKYPGAQANRSVIESTAEVLLSNPEAAEQQRMSQYSKYLTCATGLLVTKGALE